MRNITVTLFGSYLKKGYLSCILWIFFSSPVLAQWQTQNVGLNTGMNAIYLRVEPYPQNITELIRDTYPEVKQIWKWNDEFSTVQFISDPEEPVIGAPEWLNWDRNNPGLSNLQALQGDQAYLIEVSTNVNLSLRGKPIPARRTWQQQAFNLVGFQSNPDTYLSHHFEEFLALSPQLSMVNKLYTYENGSLATKLALHTVPVTPGQGYWIRPEELTDFVGPLHISMDVGNSFDFGDEILIRSMRIKNVTTGLVMATITQLSSEASPITNAVDEVAGPVPLSWFRPSTTGLSENAFVPITGPFQVIMEGGAEQSLTFGIRRAAMNDFTPSAGRTASYQSILNIEDSLGLMRHHIGVSAKQASFNGLWMGLAQVGKVFSPDVGAGRADRPFRVSEIQAMEQDQKRKYVEGYIVGSYAGNTGFNMGPAPFPTDALIVVASSSTETDPANGVLVNFFGTSLANDWGLQTNPHQYQRRILFEGVHGSIDVSAQLTPGSILPIFTYPANMNYYAPDTGQDISTTMANFPLNLIVHRQTNGTTKLLHHVFHVVQSNGTSVLKAEIDLVNAFDFAKTKRFSTGAFPSDGPLLSTSGSMAINDTLSFTVQVPHDHPSNPFVHTYHPDHDNKDARFENDLSAGQESFSIVREIDLVFEEDPPPGVNDPGWGSTAIGGTYREEITGLHKESLQVEGIFVIRKISGIAELEE